jgi:oxygen-independent coproporphyrinogen-3 oxidase
VLAALSRLRGAGFPTLNIDLIYGVQGQTVASWLESIRAALRFSPEELYLYPLYVRPLTGLGKRGRAATDLRLECYREGRALLLSAGYRQLSMRMFRANNAPAESGPVYRCQEDGMVGLGCGARSYTAALHYSDEYAVGRQGVREILAAYLSRPDEELTRAYYGYALDAEDQRRRYAILSLLSEGLSLAEYRARFGAEPFSDLPELGSLAPLGLAAEDGGRLALTPLGLERSDVIGPWLASRRARERMGGYELR